MVAKLQRVIVIAAILAAALFGAATARETTPWAGIAAGLVLLTGYVWILGVELLCAWLVESLALRPSAGHLIRAWGGEAAMAARVFCWRQPFRSKLIDDRLPKANEGRRGVLLVHGFVCNRGFWNPWMRRLRQSAHPYMAIDLEPVFASIEAHSEAIDDAVTRLHAAAGLRPVIVAHSMGGLAVRHWLRVRGHPSRVHRIITIGTPHKGTWLARFGMSENGRQMAIGSEWLQALASDETQDVYRHFTCFYGNCDNVVFPSACAQLAGADNRHIGKTAHVSLAFREEVFAETLRWLDAPEAVAVGEPAPQ